VAGRVAGKDVPPALREECLKLMKFAKIDGFQMDYVMRRLKVVVSAEKVNNARVLKGLLPKTAMAEMDRHLRKPKYKMEHTTRIKLGNYLRGTDHS
jgi:hypothetical protein